MNIEYSGSCAIGGTVIIFISFPFPTAHRGGACAADHQWRSAGDPGEQESAIATVRPPAPSGSASPVCCHIQRLEAAQLNVEDRQGEQGEAHKPKLLHTQGRGGNRRGRVAGHWHSRLQDDAGRAWEAAASLVPNILLAKSY
jgi:hypothetical protein